MFEIDSKHVCSNNKKQSATKQKKKSRALKRLIKAKKIKDQELWEDIRDTENEWLNFSTNYYDVASKKWLDYTTYWSNRIKEKLKFYGIFISDEEIGALDTDLEFFYEYEIDTFAISYKLSKTSKGV